MRSKNPLWRRGSSLFLLATLTSASCTGYHVCSPSEVAEGGPVFETSRAHVVNPELEEEMRILRESRLYELTPEPAPVNIRLSPLEVKPYGCGGGLFLTVLTLGLGPGAVNEDFTFAFEECETGMRHVVTGRLTHRYGIQELFSAKGRAGPIGEAVGKALRSGRAEAPTTHPSQ
jgi:hypothetical protein